MAFRATITVIRAEVDTKYVSPSASINNVNAEAIAFVNPDSKNQWFYDTYALGDVNVLVINKNLSETIPLSEDFGWEYNKPKVETLALVESFVKAVTYNRSFTDAFTLDDLSQIDKDFYGNKGNVAFITDIIGLDHNKVLADSYTVTDVVNIAMLFVRTFTDSFNINDELSHSFIKNVEDAFTLDDSALINKDFTGNKGNVFGVSDLLGNNFGKALIDNISQLDEVSILYGLNKSDSTTLSDTYKTTLNKAISDAFTLDDSALIDKDYFGNKGNVFSFSDVLSYDASKDLIDGIALVELVGFVLNHPVEDSYTVSDTNTVFSSLGKSDSIGFSDTYIRNIMKGLSDGFALDDSAQVNKDTSATKGNVFGFSDVFSRSVSFNRAYTENIGLSEVLVTSMVFNRAYADSYSVSDVSNVHLTKIFTDNFTVFDDFITPINTFLLNEGVLNEGEDRTTLNVDLNRPESLILNEIIGLTHSKNETDLATLIDDFGLQLEKTFTDAFTLDDSALIDKNYFGNKGNVVGVTDQVTVDYYYGGLLGQRPLNTISLN
jgi:hypothetical protein